MKKLIAAVVLFMLLGGCIPYLIAHYADESQVRLDGGMSDVGP